MGKKLFPVCILFLALFVSCATRRGAMVSPSPDELALNSAVGRVKQNSPEIEKYFILDENKDIIVKAEIQHDAKKPEHFEVIYDLRHPKAEGSGGFLIPFTVKSETGKTKQDKLFWKPQEDNSGLLLSFDDDYTEAWEQNFDLFDRYNARVTFFIQGEYTPFCNEALERGHDVGYHTLNHLNPLKISREEFLEESLSKVEDFRSAGVPLESYAYPFGLSEEWMHEELLKSFKLLRGYGVTFRLYDSEQIRKGYIASKALDNILFKKDEDFDETVDLMFRTVKFIGRGLILPLTTHDISDAADWGIKPHRLQYLLQAAHDLQLKFYRYCDF